MSDQTEYYKDDQKQYERIVEAIQENTEAIHGSAKQITAELRAVCETMHRLADAINAKSFK